MCTIGRKLAVYFILGLMSDLTYYVGTRETLIPRTGLGCTAPNLMLNRLSMFDTRGNEAPVFNSLSELKFVSAFPNPVAKEEPRDCMIKCVNGDWIGPLCKDLKTGNYTEVLRTCEFDLKNQSDYDIAINNVTVDSYEGYCPDRTMIKLKCKGAPGLYKQEGEMYTVCVDGRWSVRFPKCIPTNTITNDSSGKYPPTIKYSLVNGSMVIDNENQLVLFPGSILQLDCMCVYDEGDPNWLWPNEDGNYMTGWTKRDDHQWTFRVVLYAGQPYDSGEYLCSCSRKLTNFVMIRIQEIYCHEIHLNRRTHHLVVESSGNHVGQQVQYSCPEGFKLIGSATATCMDTGKWSERTPKCHRISCPLVVLSEPYLTIESFDYFYGGTIVFGCEYGYRLDGYNRIRCRENGQWTYANPKCIEIKCPPLAPPKYGRVLEGPSNGKYVINSMIVFGCDRTFELEGEDLLICTDNGTWSAPLPTCEKKCPYPITDRSSIIKPLKFFYRPGDKVMFQCKPPLVITGADKAMLQPIYICLEDGTWSHPFPVCAPGAV